MAEVIKKNQRVYCSGEYLSTFGQTGTVVDSDPRWRRCRVKYDDGFVTDHNWESLEVID